MNNEHEQKQINRIRNAGAVAEGLGLLIFLSATVISYLVFKKYDTLVLILVIVNAIIGLIYVILGWLIRKDSSPNVKKKLHVMLGLSIVVLLLNIFGSKNGLMTVTLGVMLIASSLLGLDGAKKLYDPNARLKDQAATQLRGMGKVKDLFKMIGIAIVVILVLSVIIYFGTDGPSRHF